MKRRLPGIIAACALLVPAAAIAQTGTLAGRVTDENGEGLKGATIRIMGTQQGAHAKEDGKFILAGVKAGTYTIVVSYVGKAEENREVTVSIDRTTTINVTLRPKGGTVVTVIRERGPAKAERVTSGGARDGAAINKTTRAANIFSAITLTNGVSTVGQNGLGIRGARSNDASMRVDGTEISDLFGGGFGNTSVGLYPTVTTLAVQEVQALTSGFGAEYGDVLSGVVNTALKNGRNDRYEGAFRFRTNVPALYGSSDPITVKKAGTDIDTTLPGVTLTSSETKVYEFAVGGPIPGVSALTFFITGKLQNAPFNGGYEVFDMSREFAESRRKVAEESWGFALEPTNLSRMPHTRVRLRNYQGKFKLDFTPGNFVEFGGELGLTSSESGAWSSIYQFDHPTFYSRDNNGAIVDSTVNRSILERDAQQWNTNTIINRGQVRYHHTLDDATFFEVTGSWVRQVLEQGKKDESKSYDGLGDVLFGVFDIYDPADSNKNGAMDRYEYTQSEQFLNPNNPTKASLYERSPITGLFEGGEVNGASRNPYGLVDANFPVHGNDRVLEQREAVELRLKGNYETNFDVVENLRAQIKAGFEVGQTTLRRHENNLPWNPVPFFDVYGYSSTYFLSDSTGRLSKFFEQPYKPIDGALYVQTKFAYKSIYFQPGVRFDVLIPGTQRPPRGRTSLADILDEIDSLGDASVKFQVSPRVGVSYPVTETSQFRVNFAMMFKMPEFNLMYDNAYNDASRGNQLFGNPDIDPQKAVVYDLGYSADIAEDYSVDISAFYRDIYNQTGVTFVPAIPSPYLIFTVTEYGNVRGFEVSARRALKDNIGAEINYTLQRAVGTASSPTANYSITIGGVNPYTGEKQELPLVEYPLNYDQTHSLNGSIYLSYGEGEGPSIGGTKLLENLDVSLTATFGSGLPYTRENSRGEQVSEYNALRLPSGFSTELHIERGFKMSDLLGESVGNLQLSLYADIFNVLNMTGPSSYRLSRSTGGSRFSIAGSPDTDGSGFERTIGDFISTPYYKDIDPARPDTWDQSQYDDFGTRRYNPYADVNLDGIVTQSERYEGYQRFIATIQTLRGFYQQPRVVQVGFKVLF